MGNLSPCMHLSDDPIATALRDELDRAGILSVALVGPPGAGKTTLIEATASRLKQRARLAIVAANPAAQRDADRLASCCGKSSAVQTATPSALGIRDSMQQFEPYQIDLLLIESMGGIGGAPDLGQHLTVAVFSTSGGDDKAAEYSELLSRSDAVLVTKSDLEPYVKFDRKAFCGDVDRINPKAEYMYTSVFNDSTLDQWANWIFQKLADKNTRFAAERAAKPSPEWFFG